MKYIKSINEFYHRTVGFRYSEPSLKFTVSCYYVGQASEEQISNTLKDGNTTFDDVFVDSEVGEIPSDGPEPLKVDGSLSFDLSVYSERELDDILERFTKSLYVNYRIKIVDVSIKEHGKDEKI